MTTTKGANGTIAANDLLDDLEDTAPVARKTGPRTATAFVPDPALYERIAGSFSRTGAFSVGKPFSVKSDGTPAGDAAHKADNARAAIYTRTAEAVADSLPVSDTFPRGCSIRVVKGEDAAAPGVYKLTVQLTHRRRTAEEIAAAKEAAAKEAAAK
jgi:hypothetical protein